MEPHVSARITEMVVRPRQLWAPQSESVPSIWESGRGGAQRKGVRKTFLYSEQWSRASLARLSCARGAAGKKIGPGHLAGGVGGGDTSRSWSGSLGTGKSRPFTPHLSWEGPSPPQAPPKTRPFHDPAPALVFLSPLPFSVRLPAPLQVLLLLPPRSSPCRVHTPPPLPHFPLHPFFPYLPPPTIHSPDLPPPPVRSALEGGLWRTDPARGKGPRRGPGQHRAPAAARPRRRGRTTRGHESSRLQPLLPPHPCSIYSRLLRLTFI